MLGYLTASAAANVLSTGGIAVISLVAELEPASGAAAGALVETLVGMTLTAASFAGNEMLAGEEGARKRGLPKVFLRAAWAAGALEVINLVTRAGFHYLLMAEAKFDVTLAAISAGLAATLATTAIVPLMRGHTNRDREALLAARQLNAQPESESQAP
jgi:hypothetical protein